MKTIRCHRLPLDIVRLPRCTVTRIIRRSPTSTAVPAFGLNIDFLQAVAGPQLHDAVNAAVAATPDCLTCRHVAHFHPGRFRLLIGNRKPGPRCVNFIMLSSNSYGESSVPRLCCRMSSARINSSGVASALLSTPSSRSICGVSFWHRLACWSLGRSAYGYRACVAARETPDSCNRLRNLH